MDWNIPERPLQPPLPRSRNTQDEDDAHDEAQQREIDEAPRLHPAIEQAIACVRPPR